MFISPNLIETIVVLMVYLYSSPGILCERAIEIVFPYICLNFVKTHRVPSIGVDVRNLWRARPSPGFV